MSSSLRIGLVGLDTSHVSAFARLLNDPADPFHIPGARITVAFPGGSEDFELSRSRVGTFTAELQNTRGVKIVATPEEVAAEADLVFIESVDGRVHRDQLDRVLKARKPVFIDKPLAVSAADARHMFAAAAVAGVPLMSSSAIRYCDVIQQVIGDGVGILGCDVYGPMTEEPTQPGLFWYGIHAVEMLVSAMGAGWAQVSAIRTETSDVVTVRWQDGRLGVVHGLRGGHSKFGILVHRADGVRWADSSQSSTPYYAVMLREILQALPQGRSAIPTEQTLAVIHIIEAANESRQTGKSISNG